MRLNWNSFALEEGGYECPYDHVSVYDNSTRLGSNIWLKGRPQVA